MALKVISSECPDLPWFRITSYNVCYTKLLRRSTVASRGRSMPGYDFARKDANGNERELHTDYALDTIDFSKLDNAKVKYLHNGNGVSSLVSCDYFKTQVLELNTNFERDFYELDSFLVFMCVDGAADIVYSGEKAERIQKGETVLIPAELKSISYNFV